MLPKQLLFKTAAGNKCELHMLTKGRESILLVGGVHGDEPEGFFLVEKFMKESSLWNFLEGNCSLFVIPRLNPDGCASNQRTNSRGVDLNRNMPTKDWTPEARAPRYYPGASPNSELETQTLIQVIESIKPKAIISCHSWEPMINFNGPAKNLASAMATKNQYRISDDIGYPTPGSLGTWSGWERKIPTITLEIERDCAQDKIWSLHSPALEAALRYLESNHEELNLV